MDCLGPILQTIEMGPQGCGSPHSYGHAFVTARLGKVDHDSNVLRVPSSPARGATLGLTANAYCIFLTLELLVGKPPNVALWQRPRSYENEVKQSGRAQGRHKGFDLLIDPSPHTYVGHRLAMSTL